MRFGPQQIITTSVIAGTFLLMLSLETFRPLRRSVESRLRRLVRNLTTGAVSLAVLTLLQAPLLVPAVRWAEQHQFGLLNMTGWPRWVEVALAIVLLDYTLWIWHVANHKVPLLWRFHLVHHVDRDLDASTGLRFHFGELFLSLFYRALQLVLIGADSYAVWLWQTILFASILFHHSNYRLPATVERWVVPFLVTPRMHGIHHSDRINEVNSNWSSLLTCWDYLHGTLRLNVPQQEITIGVPAYREPRKVTIGRILALPFARQQADWLRPDGRLSEREHPASDPRSLAP